MEGRGGEGDEEGAVTELTGARERVRVKSVFGTRAKDERRQGGTERKHEVSIIRAMEPGWV